MVNFIEEILPLVDLIPTATTAWLIELLSLSISVENNSSKVSNKIKYSLQKENEEDETQI